MTVDTKLKPAWPGKLLAWPITHPITLKPFPRGFDPTGPTPKENPNLWTYRRAVDKWVFLPGTGVTDISLINWAQNDAVDVAAEWFSIP